MATNRPPSESPEGLFEEERPSGVFDTTKSTVRLLARSAEDTRVWQTAATEAGLFPDVVREASEVTANWLRGIVVLDSSMPKAPSLVASLANRCKVVVLTTSDEEDLALLRAGAEVVIRRPVCTQLLAFHLRRLREHLVGDESARDRLERGVASARTSAVRHVAASIALEITTPLTVARLNLEFFKEKIRQWKTQRSANWDVAETLVVESAGAIDRIDLLMDELRSLANSRAPTLEPVVLSEVVLRAIQYCPKPQGVVIELSEESKEVALGQAEMLERVVTQLLANAYHALETVAFPQVVVRVYRSLEESRISVRDNGPGVPEELKERIFEPFFTTKGRERAGVGLSVCRELVARMGGALTLGTKGPGACFRIRLRPV